MTPSKTSSASWLPSIVGGVTKDADSMETYLWLCWEYDATLCLTSWWVSALDTPSTLNVKTACSMTEWCPIPTILDRVLSASMSSMISEDGFSE